MKLDERCVVFNNQPLYDGWHLFSAQSTKLICLVASIPATSAEPTLFCVALSEITEMKQPSKESLKTLKFILLKNHI